MTTPVYAYRFIRVPATPLAAQFGAYHGIEVPYIFGNLDAASGYTKEDFLLSRRMMDFWTNFAKTGSPGGRRKFLAALRSGQPRVLAVGLIQNLKAWIQPR